jgi:hypothetical protein
LFHAFAGFEPFFSGLFSAGGRKNSEGGLFSVVASIPDVVNMT